MNNFVMQIHRPSLSSVLGPLGAITQYVGRKRLSCCIVTAIFQNATVPSPHQLKILFRKNKVPCVPRGNLHSFPNYKTLFFWPKPVADPCPSDCATTRSHQVSTLTCTTVQPAPWQLLEKSENELEEVVKKIPLALLDKGLQERGDILVSIESNVSGRRT